jgi:DNA-binding transcriptional LysR family regulator
MDWRTFDFSWDRARSFLATAEAGSFSGAARALGSTQPTVGRQVAQLEAELGVVLFERIGNQLEPTEAGLELAEHVRAMAEAAQRVLLTATGRSTAVEGLVRLTASQLICAHLLGPVVQRLRREHPGIHLELVAANDVRDLQRREADLAVRNVAPTEPELVSRKVGDRRARFYASPTYLASIGHPVSRQDFERAEFFGFPPLSRMLPYLHARGLHLTERHFPVLTDDHLVQWTMCRAGYGICSVIEEVGDHDPAVVRVMPDLEPFPVPLHLTAHREVRTSRRVRIVFDALADALADPPSA